MTATRPARVGIVGCGNVSDQYLRGCARFAVIELAACADIDPDSGVALGEGRVPSRADRRPAC